MTAWEHDREGLRWGSSLGIAVLAHASLVGAVLWWRSGPGMEPPPMPAQSIMVELAPTPSAPPTPPTELPPGPPQQEQPQTPPRTRTAPAMQPVLPRAAQERADVAESSPTPRQQTDQDAKAGATETTAAPSVNAPANDRYAAPQSLAGSADQIMVTWQAQLLGHLEHHKRYPRPAQRRRQEGIAQVQFSVDRQGGVSRIHIARTSGYATLDDETLATVMRAAPLPPPPRGIKGDPVEVVVPVEFFLRK